MESEASAKWLQAVGRRKPWTTDDARRVLDAWQASGQTMTAFATRHGLVPQRLCWWRSRVGAAPKAELVAAATFVPVTVRPTDPIPTIATVWFGDSIRVELRDLDGAAASFVASVVRALEAP